jgi:hypothetical protein
MWPQHIGQYRDAAIQPEEFSEPYLVVADRLVLAHPQNIWSDRYFLDGM